MTCDIYVRPVPPFPFSVTFNMYNIPQKFHSREVMVTDSVKRDEWKGQKDQQRETSSEEAVIRLVFVLILQEGWQIPLG